MPAFDIELDLTFDSSQDIEYIEIAQLINENPEEIRWLDDTERNDMKKDGAFVFDFDNPDEKLEWHLKGYPSLGQGVYLRYKLDPNSGFNIIYSNEGGTTLGFNIMAYQDPGFFISGNRLVMTHEEQGALFFTSGHWFSQYFWTEMKDVYDQKQIVFYNIIWDEENPAIYFLERAIIQKNDIGSQPELKITGNENETNGKLYLDSLQIVSGNSLDFIKEKSNDFSQYSDLITEFFTSLPLKQ